GEWTRGNGSLADCTLPSEKRDASKQEVARARVWSCAKTQTADEECPGDGRPRKDGARRRNAGGRSLASFDPPLSEWGNLFGRTPKILWEGRTANGNISVAAAKKSAEIPLVAASERGGAQTFIPEW